MKEENIVFQILNTIVDMVFISILWLVCSLGIITFGASCTAAYYCMVKCVRKHTGYIHKEFFNCFKENFKRSTIITVVYLIIAAIIVIDFMYIFAYITNLSMALFIILVFVSVLVTAFAIFTFPILSRFDNTARRTMKNARSITGRYLYLAIVFVGGLLLAIGGVLAAPVLLLIIPGVYIYLLSYPMEWILHKYMPKAEEGSEEAEMWYNKQ